MKANGKFGFVNREGELVIAPQFRQVQWKCFHEGMCAAQTGEKEDYKWGCIDRAGRLVILPNNYGGAPFSDGLAAATIDSHEGFMDKTGKLVIQPNFYEVWSHGFENGLAFVVVDDDETWRSYKAYIDTSGKVIYRFPEENAARQQPDANNPHYKIRTSVDVAWLERSASSTEFAAETFNPSGGLANHAKDLSAEAYYRLGALGTVESLAAQRRVEDRAKREAAPAAKFVTLGAQAHPGWHFGDEDLRPLAQATSADGTTYAIVYSSMFGDADFFLTSSRTPSDLSSWTRPKLIPNRTYRGVKDLSLAINGADELILSFTQEEPPLRALMEGTHDPGPAAPKLGRQQWRLSIKEIERDSDGDGIPDGLDVCPNYAAPASDEKDEDAQILARAVFGTFGGGGSRYLLLVGEKSRRIAVWSYKGVVIYGESVESWSKRHQYGAVYVNWRIRKKTDKLAIVEITDFEGALAAGGQEVKLRKVGSEWVVVDRRTTWVS